MATKFAAFRNGRALKPCDQDGVDAVDALTPGEPVMCSITQPRSLPQHRLFFGLINLVHENLPTERALMYPKPDNLRYAVQRACGLFEVRTDMSGVEYMHDLSIAFENMDQVEFGKFFKDAVDTICKFIIEDLDNESLLYEIGALLDGRQEQ